MRRELSLHLLPFTHGRDTSGKQIEKKGGTKGTKGKVLFNFERERERERKRERNDRKLQKKEKETGNYGSHPKEKTVV